MLTAIHEYGNDLWVDTLVLMGQKTGFFVEIGAYDGLETSSCLMFEKRGWKGICVEPNQYLFERLVVNRPNSMCVNMCMYERDEPVSFIEIPPDNYGTAMKSGVFSYVKKYRSWEWEQIANAGTVLQKTGIAPSTLLKNCNAPLVIDFMAIDAEGSEKAIIDEFPWSDYQVRALCVELSCEVSLPSYLREVKNPYNTQAPWEHYFVHESLYTDVIRRSDAVVDPTFTCLR